MNLELIKSKGAPEYVVWVKDRRTSKWHAWGQVHSPEDYPNLLEDINAGKYYNRTHKDNHDYVESNISQMMENIFLSNL